MIGLRLAVFLFFLGPILCGFGLCVSARAQDAPLRAEIEVNTTVLDELEGYNPPPMFGTPDRPVLSRPIERLAFPARAAQPDTHNLKKKAEKDGLQLARPIIEDAPRGASAVPKAPAPGRFAAQKPESDEPRDRIAAPVPTPKPQIAASESSKLAAAAPVPPPPPRRASQAAPVSPRAAESNIVKSSARDAQRPPLSRTPAKLAENTESTSSPRPPAAPVETSVENPALMPAMPTPAVMRQALATGQNPDPPRTPAPPVSGENLLSAPETPLPAAAEALAGLEPAAGGHDITAYEPPEASVVPVSADISAGPALKRPDAVPDDTRERSQPPDSARGVFEEATMSFRKGQSDLEPSQTGDLKTRVSTALVRNPRARIQILSFASAADGSQSSARRVSLLRALSVRGWLVSRGIAPSRIDVRALGEGAKDGSPDRIDLVVFDPARRP